MAARVWTYQIRGGTPFTVDVPNNRSLSHNGSLTIYHLVGSKVIAEALDGVVANFGAQVSREGVVETPEQTKYHQEYIESKASLFPCMECVKCFWLDLHADGYCGLDSWGEITREQSLKWYEKARSDANTCPLGRGTLGAG